MLDKIYLNKLDLNMFQIKEKILFFNNDVILAPKMTKFLPFSPKMTYFDQIDPINDMFEQRYINKPYFNNF